LIVGAGISGIGAGVHLQRNCPDRTFAVLEGRDVIGGTWDLFRYPGIRSDSDMYTLGFSFRPWTSPKAIADGPAILEYLRETAREHGIDRKIRFRHWVERASWSSEDARWTVEARRTDTGETVRLTCSFLFLCGGYYDYAGGYSPEFEGIGDFRGRVVHPQKWTPDVEYAGKRVVVIGSGATAVTLVPALAEKAAHVTMLQRSPSYVVSLPSEDRIANWLRRKLPERVAYSITRWKNVLLTMAFFSFCRRFPERAKALILAGVRAQLPKGYDVEKHFTPAYKPWDQRLCLVPNSDLFQAIKKGHASVVTDHIDRFTPSGIRLRSGAELEADVVVTATGLKLQVLNGIEFAVDGEKVDPASAVTYKGMMLSDVPNLALSIGYTNASWTLKCDLCAEYVCRLLNHMAKHGHRVCCARNVDPTLERVPLIDFSSGYVRRSIDKFPKQGSRKPWRLYQNYALDRLTLGYGSVVDEAMRFS
jgi:cation diffusion facilitator CzcD-associated flavoprotein CzcO